MGRVVLPSHYEFFGRFGEGSLDLLTNWSWRPDAPQAEAEGWPRPDYREDDSWTPTRPGPVPEAVVPLWLPQRRQAAAGTKQRGLVSQGVRSLGMAGQTARRRDLPRRAGGRPPERAGRDLRQRPIPGPDRPPGRGIRAGGLPRDEPDRPRPERRLPEGERTASFAGRCSSPGTSRSAIRTWAGSGTLAGSISAIGPPRSSSWDGNGAPVCHGRRRRTCHCCSAAGRQPGAVGPVPGPEEGTGHRGDPLHRRRFLVHAVVARASATSGARTAPPRKAARLPIPASWTTSWRGCC